MKVEQLIIKIKSLAAEARIIKDREKQLSKQIEHYKKYHQVKELDEKTKRIKWNIESLSDHRRGKVRWEARHALIVRRMMKGYSYAETEPECKDGGPNLQKIYDMALRFGIDKQEVWKWTLEAKEYYKTKKWYSGQIKVFPHKYIKYPIHEADKVVLTQELYNTHYVDPEPTRETKIKGILAKIIKRD